MASSSVSTGERLLALIDDIELISKYVIMSNVFLNLIFTQISIISMYTYLCIKVTGKRTMIG
jgi:hypothetical protein